MQERRAVNAAPREPGEPSEARDLRQVIEVRVTREEMQLVLYDQGGDPEVVRRDGVP
jgi:hypothetical protein